MSNEQTAMGGHREKPASELQDVKREFEPKAVEFEVHFGLVIGGGEVAAGEVWIGRFRGGFVPDELVAPGDVRAELFKGGFVESEDVVAMGPELFAGHAFHERSGGGERAFDDPDFRFG